ncbi:unnamed protein product, partial [Leptidea sinapis]
VPKMYLLFDHWHFQVGVKLNFRLKTLRISIFEFDVSVYGVSWRRRAYASRPGDCALASTPRTPLDSLPRVSPAEVPRGSSQGHAYERSTALLPSAALLSRE